MKNDKDKRALIFSEISKYEKKAAKYQMSANNLYSKLTKFSSINLQIVSNKGLLQP